MRGDGDVAGSELPGHRSDRISDQGDAPSFAGGGEEGTGVGGAPTRRASVRGRRQQGAGILWALCLAVICAVFAPVATLPGDTVARGSTRGCGVFMQARRNEGLQCARAWGSLVARLTPVTLCVRGGADTVLLTDSLGQEERLGQEEGQGGVFGRVPGEDYGNEFGEGLFNGGDGETVTEVWNTRACTLSFYVLHMPPREYAH